MIRIDLLPKVIIIRGSISPNARISRCIKRRLRLCRFCLLPALLLCLLLLHLLVAQRRQPRRNLLNLLTRQILRQLLNELLQKQRVLPFLRVGSNQRCERFAQLFELAFGVGCEEGQRGEVDGGAGRGLVGYGDVFRGLNFVGDGEVAEEFFGLGARAVDFLLAKADAALGFRLFLVALVVVLHLPSAEGCLSMFLDPLRLGLVVCFCLSFRLCLGLGGLLFLFAFDFGVLGGVP
jgi:hypothetical protein